MFHHRLTLTGPGEALVAAGAELVAIGATPIGAGSFITSRPDGAESWRSFSEDHPSIRISVDLFTFPDSLDFMGVMNLTRAG